MSDLNLLALCNRASKDKKKFKNKEELANHVHHTHNFLRNNGFGYNMEAMKTFILFYCLKLINNNIELFAKDNLKEYKDKEGEINYKKAVDEVIKYCKFNDFLTNKYDIDNQKLYEHIVKTLSILKKYFNDIIPIHLVLDLEVEKYWELIMLVNDIDTNDTNLHISGKIYEYFIGRDETAISELGAYFTAREAIGCVFELEQPELKLITNSNDDDDDDEIIEYIVKTMIDPFGGSGGFTCGYAELIDKQLKEKNLKWTREMVDSIYHNDINDDVIKLARIEMFAITGLLPNKENFKRGNTFMKEFTDSEGNNLYFDLLYSNCPFGGDKTKKTEEMKKNDKILKYVRTKKSDIEKTLSPTDKKIWNAIKFKPLTTEEIFYKSLISQIKKLSDENKNTKTELDEAKIRFDNCSERIKKATAKFGIPKNKVSNKESASMVLFMDLLDKGGKCRAVFKEGIFFDKQYIKIREVLIKQFNVKYIISIPVDSFSNTKTKTSVIYFNRDETPTSEVIFYDMIVDKESDDVFTYNIETSEYELTKDKGTIIDKPYLVELSRATHNEILSNPIISLSGKDYNKKAIICGEGYELVKLGDICEFLPKSKRKASFGKEQGKYNFYTSSDKVKKCDIADYESESILIGTGGNSSIHYTNNFSCSADNLLITSKNGNNKYIYYIIKSIWELLINDMKGTIIKHVTKEILKNFQIPIPKTTAKIAEWVEKISKPYDEKNTKQAKIQELEKLIQSTIKNITENKECDEVGFGSICKFINGKKRNTTEGKTIGLYPLFSSSLNIDNWIDEFDYDYNESCIIINTINGSGKFNLHHSKKFCATSNTLIFNTINQNILLYIYYYGLINIEIINNLSNGSTKKKMGKQELSKLKIHIPKNKTLIEDMEPLFKEIETLQSDVKKAEELYKQLIKELSQEAIPNQPIITNTGTTLNDILNSSDNGEQEDNSETTLNNVLNTSDNEEQEEVIETPVIKQSKQTKSIIIKKKKE
jgi:type I restriction-modification system DNA methylase subunit